jgi:hypothetical protein
MSLGSRGRNRGLGIDWDFRNLDGFINNRADTVIHEIGLRCTCENTDTFAGIVEQTHAIRRNTSFKCDICMGEKFIYRNAKKIIGNITSISEQKVQQDSGWGNPGDCILSPKLNYIVSAGDLITFTHAQPIPDGQVILRGAANIETNARKNTNLESNEDRLYYHAAEGLWCEDEDGNTYESNNDYILDSSKIIKWVGASPAEGKLYTFKYTGYLEWIAFIPPAERRDRNRDLGQKVILKKRNVELFAKDPRLRSNERVTFCSKVSGCG